jgi:hypothetical protein
MFTGICNYIKVQTLLVPTQDRRTTTRATEFQSRRLWLFQTPNFLNHSAWNLSSRQITVKLTGYKTLALISYIYNLVNRHERQLSWAVWRCYLNTCWQRPKITAKILSQDNLPQLKSELGGSWTQVRSATTWTNSLRNSSLQSVG